MQFTEREAIARKEWYAARGIDPEGLMHAGDLFKGISPQDGDEWGFWRFYQDNLTLAFECDGWPRYEIDLERMNSRDEFVCWIAHLNEKAWCDANAIGNFVRAIYNLSFGLTYLGSPGEGYVTEAIRERYGKPTTAGGAA